MSKKLTSPVVLIMLGLLGLVLYNGIYILDQRQQAILLQFGEAIKLIKEPGLKFKIPFIQRALFFDKRILNVYADDKEVIAKDQKRIIVNAFAKYRIIDPLKFYQSVLNERGARARINSVFESSLRQVLAEEPLVALLSIKRASIMDRISSLVNEQGKNFGVEVVDVRISRADLPTLNSNAIYRRMQTDREKEAKEFRAEGAEEAKRIRSRAEKERKILLAEADKKSEILRGEGDAQANATYAKAFSADPEFFLFYRSMQAYRKSLETDDTTLVISPDSGFFKFFEKGMK